MRIRSTPAALHACCAALLLAAALPAHADLAFVVDAPAFRVSIPSLPAMDMDSHPGQAAQPHLRLHGSKDPYTVTVLTPTADAGMTALGCASSIFPQLSQRPLVPAQDRIFKARIDENTYVAIYASPMPGFVQLHAHLVSAAGGTHCVEVHASMVTTTPDDARRWFTGFGDARIEPR